MKILFITPFFWPHVGGVEKHTIEVAKFLVKKGHDVTVLTQKNETLIKDKEVIRGINIVRFRFPQIKLIGLLLIWFSLLKNIKLINEADIIHVHDVFIWYLPLKIICPHKKVVTTFHGWEGKWPIPTKNIFLKRLSALMSDKNVFVGKYIGKYYGIKTDKIIYGGVNSKTQLTKKVSGTAVFIGRLEDDTGLRIFLKRIKGYKFKKLTFVGDGSLRQECESLGVVTGFIDPSGYLKNSEYVIPGGYLSYIEARDSGCKIITYADNPLKKDYWKEIKKIKKFPTWEVITNEYLNLYNNI